MSYETYSLDWKGVVPPGADSNIKHRHARHARVIFCWGGDIVVLMEYYVS